MAAKKSYVLGSKPKLRVTFTNPDTGVASDPSVVTLKVKSPATAATTYTFGAGDTAFVKESTGVYFRRVNLTSGGTWQWTFTGVTSDDAIVVHGELLSEDPGF